MESRQLVLDIRRPKSCTYTSRKANQFLSEVQFSFVNIPNVARLSVGGFL